MNFYKTHVAKVEEDLATLQQQLEETLAAYDKQITNDRYLEILDLRKQIKKTKAELAKWQ